MKRRSKSAKSNLGIIILVLIVALCVFGGTKFGKNGHLKSSAAATQKSPADNKGAKLVASNGKLHKVPVDMAKYPPGTMPP
jgi:hypothetical protein